jgi:hypothetical protein
MDVSDLLFALAMVAVLAGVVVLTAVLCGALISVAAGLLTAGVFLAFTGWSVHKGGSG